MVSRWFAALIRVRVVPKSAKGETWAASSLSFIEEIILEVFRNSFRKGLNPSRAAVSFPNLISPHHRFIRRLDELNGTAELPSIPAQ